MVQADEAQTDTEFEKHMYAIHMLTSLVSSHQSRSTIEKLNRSKPMNSNIKDDYEMKQQTSQKHDVTVAEIEAMGGKVPQSMKKHHTSNNMMITDDHVGNGESILIFKYKGTFKMMKVLLF